MVKNDNDNVRDLLDRSRRGDSDALNRLCTMLREQVFQRIMGKIHDEDDSNELAQDTIIWFLRNYKDKIYDQNIPALLAGKAFFMLKSYFRAKYALKEVALESVSEEGAFIDNSEADSLEENADRDAAWKKIEVGVEKLPVTYREVIERRYFKELSFQEIAGELHISEDNVRQRHKRGIDMLKKRLRKKD
jgi:RNA polymerase sigma factor (sigma-70 family)